MSVHVGYQGAAACTGGPQPGARAFMAWFLGVYGPLGGTNLGIFNCRPVRGGKNTSLHGEGRAVDFGINPHRAAWGDELAENLRGNSAELGVQLLIWNRRIWSGAQPHAGWRPYSGLADHFDHIHAELTWDAARSLTAARVAAVMGGAGSGAGSRPTLRERATGALVGSWADFLRASGARIDRVHPPRFGPQTVAATRAWQKQHGLVVDGVVGPASWRKAAELGFTG